MSKSATHSSGLIECLFYLSISLLFIFCLVTDNQIVSEGKFEKVGLNLHTSFGGRYKFLTFLNLLLQNVYFLLCTLNAFYEFIWHRNHTIKSAGKLRTACNYIYTTLAFPVGTTVVILFWGIYLIDRELIFPKIIESVIPVWQNHLLHTLPLVGVLLDNLLTKHTYNKSFLKGVLTTVLVGLAYLIWIFIIAYIGGIWVYPILRVLSNTNRIIFCSVSLVLLSLFYKLGDVLNSMIWPDMHHSRIKAHFKAN